MKSKQVSLIGETQQNEEDQQDQRKVLLCVMLPKCGEQGTWQNKKTKNIGESQKSN